MTGNRMNPDLITDIFSVLDRHGYARSDDEHTARAIVLISLDSREAGVGPPLALAGW